jgi:hypothetical protein
MDLFKEVSGLFERRFLINALWPCAAFWIALLVLVVGTSVGPAEAARAWDAQSTALKSLEVVGALAVILATAGVLYVSSMGILRLFEGYWPRWLRPLSSLAERAHADRMRQLQGIPFGDPRFAIADQTLYFRYPPGPPSDAMPTRLGNILKAGELHAQSRYHLDPVLIWPRLYGLLPERAAAIVGSLRSSLELCLGISVLAAAFALVAGGYALLTGTPWFVFLLCFWGGGLVSWLAYESALPVAVAYSEQIKAIFDNHRMVLLTQLGLPIPPILAVERATWQEVGLFLMRNLPPSPEASGDAGPG